jgi:hypothetical protein
VGWNTMNPSPPSPQLDCSDKPPHPHTICKPSSLACPVSARPGGRRGFAGLVGTLPTRWSLEMEGSACRMRDYRPPSRALRCGRHMASSLCLRSRPYEYASGQAIRRSV